MHSAAETDFLLSAMRREARLQLGCQDVNETEMELKSRLFGPLRASVAAPSLADRQGQIDPADLEFI